MHFVLPIIYVSRGQRTEICRCCLMSRCMIFLFFLIWQQLVLRVVLFRVIIVSPKAELGTLHYKMKLNYIRLWKSVCEVIKQSQRKVLLAENDAVCGKLPRCISLSIPDVFIELMSGPLMVKPMANFFTGVSVYSVNSWILIAHVQSHSFCLTVWK